MSTLMCISNVFFSDKKDLLISLAALHSPYQKLNWVHFGFLNKKQILLQDMKQQQTSIKGVLIIVFGSAFSVAVRC